MLCGVVTQEKERDSLVLLLLTELRPWQIVFQKFVGGMVPGLSMLLLALPLVAICYGYGGFTAWELGFAVLLMVLATLQIGAIATWCSCRFRTTVAAFCGTYLTSVALMLIPWLVVVINQNLQRGFFRSGNEQWFGVHLPPMVFEVGKDASSHDFALAGCGAILATTLFFLLLATRALPKYAFATPSQRLRRAFSAMDRAMHAINQSFGSVSFGKRERILPGDAPIQWREMRARALAKPEYLVRILLLVLIPIVGIVLLLLPNSVSREAFGYSALAAMVGSLGTLLLSAAAANAIVSERTNQTHDLLLTTPMSARQIVLEKARSLRPLGWVVAVPLLIIFGAEMTVETMATRNYAPGFMLDRRGWTYLFCVLSVLVIDLPLIAWLSIWSGLSCRTRIKAIVLAFGLIVSWCVAPLIVLEAFDIGESSGPGLLLQMLSPLTVPALNELNQFDELWKGSEWVPVLLNAVLFGTALIVIRTHCLRRADVYLRR
jgi:ABC-type transport system involved in multi-copper enzyme maturation permease subunit